MTDLSHLIERLADDERTVLSAWDHACEEFGVLNFNAISQRSGFDRERVPAVVRSLAAKGLTRFVRGTFTEDGEPYGSGYDITDSGRALRALRAKSTATAAAKGADNGSL